MRVSILCRYYLATRVSLTTPLLSLALSHARSLSYCEYHYHYHHHQPSSQYNNTN